MKQLLRRAHLLYLQTPLTIDEINQTQGGTDSGQPVQHRKMGSQQGTGKGKLPVALELVKHPQFPVQIQHFLIKQSPDLAQQQPVFLFTPIGLVTGNEFTFGTSVQHQTGVQKTLIQSACHGGEMRMISKQHPVQAGARHSGGKSVGIAIRVYQPAVMPFVKVWVEEYSLPSLLAHFPCLNGKKHADHLVFIFAVDYPDRFGPDLIRADFVQS